MRRMLGDRGSAPVEFLLVGLLLTALTLGVLQLGFAMYVRNVVHDAAVEGAYFAALADTTLADGEARTRAIVVRAVGDGYPLDISVREIGDPVRSEIELAVTAAMPLVGVFGIPGTWEVTARAPAASLD